MRKLRTTILAGAAALMAAGSASAAMAETKRMNVALPDGSVAVVEYTGDVAPRVSVEPVAIRPLAAFAPFAGFERIAAMMEAHRIAMMRQMAALHELAMRAAPSPGGMTLAGSAPAGVSYTYVSTTTDANGCTRTVRYSSDGSGAEPQVVRASSGSCEAAQGPAQPIEANAPARPEPAQPGLEV